MGKVRELADAWDDLECASTYLPLACKQLRVAERADAAAHAAELEAKDRQIEAVQEAHYADMRRIAELEAELAKRELPPLPESVRKWLDDRHKWAITVTPYERDLIAWVDTHYPAPVPQWELDAQYLERKLGGETRSAFSPDEVRAIAARMREREAGRGSK